MTVSRSLCADVDWDHLVEVRNLKKWFPVQQGFLDQILAGHVDHVRAVDGVSFFIRRGEVFGLAGERRLSLRQYAAIFAFPARSSFRTGAWRERWGSTS